MGYGLGSDDPEEVAYYKKLRKEMEDMKKDPVKKGILYLLKLMKVRINDFEHFLLIDGS